MNQTFLKLNDIRAYTIAYQLSNYVWDIVVQWDFFAKDTVGKQFVRAIDSVSANIAEGFGRYSKKEKIQYYRYSFGSVKECLDWNQKSKHRKLLTEKQYERIFHDLSGLPKELNSLIKFTNLKLLV